MITSVGVVTGVLMAIGLNQLLVSKLEMARLPLPYLLGGAMVFYLLGIIAVYGPAWKAATISCGTGHPQRMTLMHLPGSAAPGARSMLC
ncbi:ABC transporter permease [Massilia sp. B-10]|nr:ABC transporter permease [Massilia sp. B-10]